MALRCLLVGLVASLGFQLPSGQDVTSWTRPGRDWVAARTPTLADLQAAAASWVGGGELAVPAVEPPAAAPAIATAEPTPEAPVKSVPEDLAFAAISESMATTFAADFELALGQEAAPAPAAVEVVAAEPAIQPEHDSMALAHADPEPTDATEPEASPASRLGSAVRATREAMNAWASVMQAVGREVVAR